MFQGFFLALTFLTILPAPSRRGAEARELSQSMAWFPWVGLVLGVLLAGLAWLCQHRLPPPASAALVVALLAVLTRGLHLDGLADTLDGLGGGQTREDSLRIMKDHAVGAFGAVGIALILILKYGLLTALLSREGLGWLILFPVLSRSSLVLLAYLSPYARPEGGLGQAMTTLADSRTLAQAGLSALVLAVLLGGGPGLAAAALAGACVWGLAGYFRQRLGGVTGDVFGAVNEGLEVVILLMAII